MTTIVRLQLQQLADQLAEGFDSYQASEGPLPGFTPEYRDCLIRQLVDSSRVNNYLEYLRTHSLSSAAADPSDPWFDPIKAAVIRHRQGDEDEAFWLVFLRTQFAKHRKAGWRYAREVYGALSSGEPWTWQRVVADLDGFRDWLDAHQAQLWIPPECLEALKPGRMRVHGGTAEIPGGAAGTRGEDAFRGPGA